ncbi:SAVED domain-containing protein [Bacillus sp. Cs-700]|uniref:SAVED domain-containing protein n=1 Tax=Bacillus sp. Cs-700 TaxID=2589818 RepID=UPI00140A4540|nr:SAVED domain-containing protein [Bacillus sp. Cs-700]
MVQIIRHSSIEVATYETDDNNLSNHESEWFELNQVKELSALNESSLEFALRNQEKTASNILACLDTTKKGDVSYLGLAHVPLVFLLGYQVADKTFMNFYEWNQNKLVWQRLADKKKNYPPLLLKRDEEKQKIKEVTDVIVKFGITYP